MATLPLSFVMRSNGLSCGATETAKLVSTIHVTCEKRVTPRLGKMDVERNLVFSGVAINAAKSSYPDHRLKALTTSRSLVVQTPGKVSTYLFRSEIGGQVKVFVEMKNNKYSVYVEVSSLQLCDSKDELLMSWGIYRSDSSSFMPIDFQSPGLAAARRTIETPLRQKSSGQIAVQLNLEANLAPFYLSFILKSPSDSDSKISVIRSHRKTNFCVPVGFNSGYPAPLGLSFSTDGSMNFSLLSRSAESVVLCLYDEITKPEPVFEIDLDPYVNRSGDIWHASINSAIPLVSYGYRCKGANQKGDTFHAERVLLDPYAKIIRDFVPVKHGSGLLLQCLGQLHREPAFDWTGDVRPCLPPEKLVVYRLNVMLFTEDNSSKLPSDVAGTFSGITEKLQHFKDLGVNAILLEPIFPFDEQQGPYFPFHFFSPMNKYGHSGDPMSSINSMKEMVKGLHANGIEVFVEVVFSHTAEVGSLREIDKSFYHYKKEGDSIGKNNLNCNHPIVQQMILDSLRHWVIEFHVDGFCFINAASLLRGFHGENLSRPPLVEAIAFDPILSKVKVIADSWDPHDMESKAVRFPHWRRWAEINTQFCADVRNYLRGGEGLLSKLATRLCGSGDTFSHGRGPAFSFNFIARNSGLSLVDLVSFSGSELALELSWNCGVEGATTNAAILETRLKQIRNFLFILFVSLGVPILNMGDECGKSSGGSPAYGDRKPFNWNALRTSFGIQTTEFISFLSSLRIRRNDLLQTRKFLREENIGWHGTDLSPPRWEDPSSKFLGMTLKDHKEVQSTSESPCQNGDLFIAFNAADHSESITLPPPPADMAWLRLVDTALSYPVFFSMDGEPVLEQMPEPVIYEMKSHSCVLFEARSLSGCIIK